MDINLVKQYAEFAVKIGVNPQPGQTLIIRAPIEGAFFARACAEAAYAAGAKEVVVHYSDEKLSRIKMENTAVEVLEDVKPWLQRSYLDYVESEGGEAQEMLWDAIFDVCRVKNGNVVSEWQAHVKKMTAWRDRMNALDLDSIRLQSANGTDLTIGLADGHVWEGAQSRTPEGYTFIANIPTEEVFTAPHRLRVNGVVKGTKPYVYNGNLIEGFSVTFKDGEVVEHSAQSGEALLGQLLDTDEGSRRIGEIALVPASSPINRRGILFYNTLFDENAACHIAFGKGYPGTVKGGTAMTKQELLAHGVNDSIIHEDVMVGAPDMTITGTTRTGENVKIFENGEWAF